MKIRSCVLVGLVALLVAPVSGQVSKSGNGYLLRMKLTKGATYAYDFTTSTAMPGGQPMAMTMSYTMKVQSVDAKGVASVLMTATTPMSKTPTTQTVKMDARGQLDGQPGMEQFGNVRMPEKALAVGGNWKSSQTFGTGATAMKADTTYTFRGLQNVGKVSCAVLDVSSSMKGTMSAATTGKMYLEASNGMLYKSDLTSTMTMTQQGKTQTIKSTIAIKRK
jgi:hypothetical protein